MSVCMHVHKSKLTALCMWRFSSAVLGRDLCLCCMASSRLFGPELPAGSPIFTSPLTVAMLALRVQATVRGFLGGVWGLNPGHQDWAASTFPY